MGEKRSLAYVDDADSCGYDWGYAEVFEQDGKYFVIYDSGCSCSSPNDYEPRIEHALETAGSMGELFEKLHGSTIGHKSHPDSVYEAFIVALKKTNEETVAACEAALGTTSY